MSLQRAPKTPSQLKQELFEILDKTFIIDVISRKVGLTTEDFELVIRIRMEQQK